MTELSIPPLLVEKDYWIMHCLYGLHAQGFQYYLKGGTSLSKGLKIIDRFSEDIDILIEPPKDLDVAIGKNQDKAHHRKSRENYYTWLASHIEISGINSAERDTAFDDEKFRSGGIKLLYPTSLLTHHDIKQGVLLEVGFDTVAPNAPLTISSWAYDLGSQKIDVLDNRAKDVPCYHPGYTLVEKLQTVSTKFRKQQESQVFSENFMRHYYDIYHLLNHKEVQQFIGSKGYIQHKLIKFRAGDNLNISENEAFLLNTPGTRDQYEKQYELRQTLYYKDKPNFDDILKRIQGWAPKL